MADIKICYDTVFDFKKKTECQHMVKESVMYDPHSRKRIGKQCFACEKCLKIYEPKQLVRVGVNRYHVVLKK